MCTIVEILSKFRSSQIASEITKNQEISVDSLNVISIEIIDWLSLEYKRTQWIEQGRPTKLKPMKLFDVQWCIDLVKLIESENIFKSSLKIDGNFINLNECLSEEYKALLRKQAFALKENDSHYHFSNK